MTATPIQVRFADCDMAGHVHNAAYFHYFEQARMHFFTAQLKNWDWKKTGFILKKNEIEYVKPTYLTDKIQVHVTCSHIGNSSFTLAYAVIDENQILKANGKSVVVCFDYEMNCTIPIPEKIKEVLTEHFISKN